ncbi:asparagine synthase (glutamine-hydrolyzing) [Methanococcoides burtonii]|uniref:Putative asparagine synthetase [glutamine-hydrolyzing] n=1 Tax=Methanococcoides burtonii (strain DSM 6242 / NBRC 107633 / OCM 468 / ACE-M) TaxID=259564 RepID=Q12VP2_METBU|nr:asparagine synthase (glutamine-hydrolyzing) [Methanococcoides burtonii]ABE52484.1 Asparagine synthetase (glutamine-hydrolyzing) [Methanococcoides burtonii DSM 6242]
MCGICGYAGFDDEDLLGKMCDAIVHRGPDDSGSFTDKGIGLGHRRLSIIDLEGGHQPVCNEDGTIYVVYNGEIYNFLSLRDELEKRGHRFQTSSDTEVIVHLYEEYGKDLVHHLRGMFAFALWDSNTRTLLLARDRLGVKPLYYTTIDNRLLFASEIKSIVQYSGYEKAVDIGTLHDYLTFRHALGTETMFAGIKKLLPGHVMTYREGEVNISEYWDVPLVTVGNESEDFYIKKTRLLLEESVKMRLMSEVPLGIYLSGGIDSGIVTGLMSKMVDEPIETFSVGFGERGEIGELSQAQEAADFFGTNHHEIIVDQGAFKQNLKDIIWHNDEPIADPSALAMFQLSKMASKHVTVVLNGAGGDEVFGGYISYKVGLANQKYHKIVPKVIRQGLVRPFVNAISPHLSSKMYVGIQSATQEVEEHGFLFTKSVFSEEDKEDIYTDKIKDKIHHNTFEKATTSLFRGKRYSGAIDERSSAKNTDLLSKMMYADTKSYLVDHILLETDKLTMSSSIEARVPIIDHKVVEFAASIPQELKLRGMTEKYILKKVGQGMLPPAAQNRKKRPFRIPIDTWFKDELHEMSQQVLDESSIVEQGYFRPEVVKDIMKKHERAELLYNHQMYALLVFEMWHERFMKM